MDGEYLGFIELGDTLSACQLVRNTSRVPTDADALPTFRVYGSANLPMPNGTGTCQFKDDGAVTGASNATPIVITSAGHGLTTGTRVSVRNVAGNTAANGTRTITRVDADHFSLDGTSGSGGYTSGGTWNVAGLYGFDIPIMGNDGYQKGQTYTILVQATVAGSSVAALHSFTVT